MSVAASRRWLWVSLVCSVGLVLGLLVQGSVGGAAAAAAPAEPVKPGSAAARASSGFAADTSAVVTAAGLANGKKGTKAYRYKRSHTIEKTKDGGLKVTIKAGKKLVVSGAQATPVRKAARADAAKEFGALGAEPSGVITAMTAKGGSVRVPVTITKVTWLKKKKRLRVFATPTTGEMPERVKQYLPYLFDGGAVRPSGEQRQVTVSAWTAGSRTWKWTDVGSGSVSGSGSDVTVSLAGTGNARGTQRGGQNAGIAAADLAAKFSAMTEQGVAPRMVVTGITKDRKTRVGVLTATEVSASGNTLTVKGISNGAGLPQGEQRKLFVSLETPGNGLKTRFVVVTGDSFASGEAARYSGTYINPQLSLARTPKGVGALLAVGRDVDVRRVYERFCDGIDLTCEKATVNKATEVRYVTDPGKVYEKGSWEKADDGLACHRSFVAPGTWLARYLRQQAGQDVEAINLACTGAVTDNIVDTNFKGQKPQAQELDELDDWLPIAFVTGSIGGNDVGFAEVATKCFLAPVNALDPDLLQGGSADVQKILGAVGNIFDDMERVDGQVKSINPFLSPDALCSEEERARMKRRLSTVVGKIARAVTALHEAAPDAQLVWNNYPNIIPTSTKTYFPRQEFMRAFVELNLQYGPSIFSASNDFDKWQAELVSKGPDYWPNGEVIDATKGVGVAGNPPTRDEFVQGVLDGNPVNKVVAGNIYGFNGNGPDGLKVVDSNIATQFVLNSWAFTQEPLTSTLNLGALMFGYDQDWAAGEVLPGLNKSVLAALRQVDPKGEFITAVDMTQVFNGRELGSKFSQSQDLAQLDNPERLQPPDLAFLVNQTADDDSTALGPNSGVRANFVSGIFPGQSVGTLCPNRAGTGDPRCIGDEQEALHPNWRGQAAMGQCIVAVATGAFGEGNACVRSVGVDNGALERKYSGKFEDQVRDPHLWSVASPDPDPDKPFDRLCVTAIPDRYAIEDGQYEPCTSEVDADPTWDPQTWESGKVRWPDGSGNVVRSHWR